MSAPELQQVDEWAERLQAADLVIDYPIVWEDGAGWLDQSEVEVDRWRGVARLVLAVLAQQRPDVEAVAGVLREHDAQGEWCPCGAARKRGPGAPWSGWAAHHQAEKIAALTPAAPKVDLSVVETADIDRELHRRGLSVAPSTADPGTAWAHTLAVTPGPFTGVWLNPDGSTVSPMSTTASSAMVSAEVATSGTGSAEHAAEVSPPVRRDEPAAPDEGGR